MKPAFALDLDNDAVRLLSRSDEGWLEVGKVDLGAANLDASLKALCDQAATLAPEGFATKLILPLSQILYTEIETASNDRVGQRADIVNGLKGRTPYPVSELVYDWSRAGGRARVAVIARITLDEAEAFAETYGFNPVSFVAVPPPEKFAGEPFFGITSRATEHLPEGTRLDRDQDPVRIVGKLPAPRAEADAPDAVEPAATEASLSVVADSIPAEEALPEIVPETDVAAEPEAAPEAGEPDRPETVAEEMAAAANEAAKDEADEQAEEAEELTEAASVPEPDDSTLPELQADSPLPADDGPDVSLDRSDADAPADEPRPAAPAEAAPSPTDAEPEEAPFIAIDEEAADQSFSVLEGSLPDAESDPVPPAFQTRRAPVAQRPEDEEDLRSAANRLHLTTPEAVPDLPAPRIADGLAAITAPVLDIPYLLNDEDTAASAAVRKRRSGLGRAALGAIPDAAHGTLAQQKLRRADSSQPPLAAPVLEAAAGPKGARIAGARRLPASARKTSARTLVYLSGLLILVMAAVAFGSLFVGGKTDAPAELVIGAPEASDAQTEDVIPPSDTTEAAPDIAPEPAPAETEIAAPPVEQSATDAAVASALGDPRTDGAATEPPPAPTVAAPRDVPLNAPAPSPLPEADAPGAPTISSAAPGPGDLASPADLPDADGTVTDNPPLRQPLPPPFGTVVTFGPGGLIVPTPEGVITPGGFTLFAGKPPLLPPTRPGSAEPAIAAPVAPDATDPAAPDDGAALVPETGNAPETAAAEPAVADAPARIGPKPKARPDVVVAIAAAARNKAEALAEAAAAAAKAEAERTASATAQAVASSRRPASRPRDFAKAVDAAVASAVASAAAAAPVPAPATVVAAAPAPAKQAVEEIDEPEPVALAPNMPTSVTVSRQATVKNAINLGEISLIGVFGSSSSRRALIRMPTGRFIKVKVGDRFDGGTIAAIGDSEVSYVKRGKTVVLKMVKKG